MILPNTTGKTTIDVSTMNTTTELPAIAAAAPIELYYQDGDIIETHFHVGFLFLAYFTATVGAYSAIRLLEHGLWRSKREEENATRK
jgi:hypothetical protein